MRGARGRDRDRALLDVFVVRKIGAPLPELAMGAIASGGIRVLNEEVIRAFHVPDDVIERMTCREREELERRNALPRRTSGPRASRAGWRSSWTMGSQLVRRCGPPWPRCGNCSRRA